MSQEIEQLIRSVQNGDMDAFDSLMQRFMHDVRGFLASRAPAQHLIDDLAHDTFVFAYRNIQSFNAEDAASFCGWLKAIARNYLMAELKRYKREQTNRERYGEFIEHALLEGHRDDHYFDKLQSCLQSLPQHSRDLLSLRYQKSLAGKEIAEQIERSHSWVKTNLHRLHAILRDCMKQTQPDTVQ